MLDGCCRNVRPVLFDSDFLLGNGQEDCVLTSARDSNDLFALQLLSDHLGGNESVVVTVMRELKVGKKLKIYCLD